VDDATAVNGNQELSRNAMKPTVYIETTIPSLLTAWPSGDLQIAAENGYDVDRLFDAMQREQEKYANRLVHHVPRRAPAESSAVLREEPPKAG
jgi:hypothetical protein